MKEKTLINKINKAIPEARAVPAEEFYGYKTEGIWFKGTESGYHDNKPIFYFWAGEEQVHEKLEKILDDAGWHWEPYDPGTLMAFPG
jgi:hypothetical protein